LPGVRISLLAGLPLAIIYFGVTCSVPVLFEWEPLGFVRFGQLPLVLNLQVSLRRLPEPVNNVALHCGYEVYWVGWAGKGLPEA
jgi:hypothetical protein